MEASRYFERTLFFHSSPEVDDYYETSAEHVFEKDVLKARIEVRIQNRSDGPPGKAGAGRRKLEKDENKSDIEDQQMADLEDWPRSLQHSLVRTDTMEVSSDFDEDQELDAHNDDCSVVSSSSSTAIPAALDQRQGESGPPLYPGLPKLTIGGLAPANVEAFVKETKNDFRVFYIRQRHSYSRLQITKDIFELLLKACHVFPRFNEYVIGFGRKSHETEVGPPPFRYRTIRTALGNSWRGFECSYILRYVENTNRPGGRKPWSLRQFAVYHRFKPAPDSHCSTWILIGASQRTEARLDRYTRSVDDVFQTNPFELHVIFLDTALANWRPYLAHLTQLVQEQSGRSSGFTIGSPNPGDDLVAIEVEDHQQLKQIEDDVADLLLCLDSSMDTLVAFKTLYSDFKQQRGDPENAHSADVISVAFETKAREISYTRKKAENLLSRIQNTRTLVSSLLERQSGFHIDQQIQTLQKLEQQGQDENTIMRELAEKNARDSSSMRVLTIITMVYLPCTIVSNFYSTQFVSQVESDNGHTRLEYSQNAWLFFAISIPLTVFTISVWYLWINAAKMLQFVARQGDRRNLLQAIRVFGPRQSLDKLPR